MQRESVHKKHKLIFDIYKDLRLPADSDIALKIR